MDNHKSTLHTMISEVVDSRLKMLTDQVANVRVRQEFYDQEMQKLGRLVDTIQSIVIGDPRMGLRGLAEQIQVIRTELGSVIEEMRMQFGNHLDATDAKIDALIDAGEARKNQLIGVRKAVYVLTGLLALIGGPPAVISFLKLFGVIP